MDVKSFPLAVRLNSGFVAGPAAVLGLPGVAECVRAHGEGLPSIPELQNLVNGRLSCTITSRIW